VGEPELITASQRGDVNAFNQLVLTYQQVVYNVAYRMVSDADLAADVTQDTFVSAFKAVRTFRGGSFKSWLLRIATNACYDHFRRQKRRPSDSLDEMLEEPGSEAVFEDHAEGLEDHALRREMVEYIQRGLDGLPEDQRLVVILSDVQGLSYEEIADATGASLGTVKSRLSRGRARLRDFLLRQRELLPSHYRPKSRDATSAGDIDAGEELSAGLR
jgi:RNA polymerase sigma-70 factor, ECF subfamily